MKIVWIFSFLAFFCTLKINAQNITTATIDQVVAGMKNITYVVLPEKVSTEVVKVEYQKIVADTVVETENQEAKKIADESEFNKALRAAVNNFWKVTKFEFINQEEFEEKKLDPTCSFIFLSKIRESFDDTRIEFSYLIYAIGSPKAKKVEKMPWIAAIPVSYHSIGSEYYNYKIAGLVKFLQNHADYAANNPNLTKESIEKYYNDKNREIKDFVLYVLAEDLTSKVYTEAQISEIYPGEVKVVTQAEIRDALKKDDQNIVFFHKVGPEHTKEDGICRKYVITAKGGELLYYLEDDIIKSRPEGLLEYDLKQFKRK